MNALDVDSIDKELAWLEALIDTSIRLHFDAEGASIDMTAPPGLDARSGLGRLVHEHDLGIEERIVVALALAPHLRPAVLDAFLLRNPHTDRRFTEFGGTGHTVDPAFRPTLETAAFLVARGDLARRMALPRLFAADHVYRRKDILEACDLAPGASVFEMPLRVTDTFVSSVTGGTESDDPPGRTIAARRIESTLEWADLALSPSAAEDLDEILAWLADPGMLRDDPHLARHFKPGYRALFHGPPGTGKTLAAALLGKAAGVAVYRVDLSLIASKWVGETEKNLGEIFAFAERRRCILFFDEADSIFGKRSSSGGGQDRYANLEVSYLLQRIEDFTGLVVLATNIKSNLDEAFVRRFQSMVYFAPPDAAGRLKIWHSLFPDPARRPAVDFDRLAADYDLTGSTIANVARHAMMRARRDAQVIGPNHIHDGIRREYRKMSKTFAEPSRTEPMR